MRKVLAVLALTLASACGSDSGTSPTASLTGAWSGPVGTQTLSLSLVENSGVVTGSGTLTGTPTGTRAQTVAGTFNGATLNATLSSGSVQPVNLTATLAGTKLSGNLVGSGFTGDAIVLTRQ